MVSFNLKNKKKWVIDGNKANGKLVETKEDASDINPGLN